MKWTFCCGFYNSYFSNLKKKKTLSDSILGMMSGHPPTVILQYPPHFAMLRFIFLKCLFAQCEVPVFVIGMLGFIFLALDQKVQNRFHAISLLGYWWLWDPSSMPGVFLFFNVIVSLWSVDWKITSPNSLCFATALKKVYCIFIFKNIWEMQI